MSSRNVFPCSVITSINHEKIAHEHDKHLQHTVNKIKEIMMSQRKANKALEELIILDALQRLGLAYYFKDEFHAILNSQFVNFNSCEKNASIDNLHEIALRFRLLRQEGYDISPDIFKRFKNNDGKFQKQLSNDLRGLLSLFEATQWSIQDEDILDEASQFSEHVLKASLMEDIEQSTAEVILYTLQNPVHKSLPTRLLDKNFLFTEFLRDFTGSKNWMDEVMKLASLDFEMVQISSRKELFQVSLWEKELNSAKKLQFARIRPIKWYMWSSAILPWPSMAKERIELAKVASFIYVIDDIFDVLGTLDELTLFTEVINRWECDDVDHLPDYMKVCLKALYDFMKDFSHKICKKYKWDPKYSLMKVWIDLCNSFLLEAKWLKLGQLPSAKEYLDNGIISVGGHLVLMHAFFLLGGVNQRSIDEMNRLPCIVSSAAIIVRLWNDIGTDQRVWSLNPPGAQMACILSKLKLVKAELKALNREHFGDIGKQFVIAKQKLERLQMRLHSYPEDKTLSDQERAAAVVFKEKSAAYHSFLGQRAKCFWLKEGDDNTSFFHASLKQRRVQNHVLVIKNEEGEVIQDPAQVPHVFVNFYKKLLGSNENSRSHLASYIVKKGSLVSEQQGDLLCRPFERDEVKRALFSIPGNKSPGPDGFNSQFFKDAWGIVGEDIIDAVLEFFDTSKLTRQLNATTLSMIPKKKNALNVTDFRPIACCNTIYKCITKLLCSRLKLVLPKIISAEQSGFVEGRNIVHNIMICHDLVAGLSRKQGKPRCLIKIDLKKAYDSVDWDFLEEIMYALEFPTRFIKWIMECVSTPMFSIAVNGSLHGFFPGKRGLRQGDPMSPLLFVICIEYLSRLLKHISEDGNFNFFPRCSQVQLNHLCFADDLMLFCKGDYKSVYLMLSAFKSFSAASGLHANPQKSEIFMGNIDPSEKRRILHVTGYVEGKLPVKYLGIPLKSKRLNIEDCEVLIEKVTARIRGWQTRHLSYVGRVTLINSVLLSLHTYWAMIFILPKAVIQRIVAVCRCFLWEGKINANRAPLASWDLICKEKKAGGVGLRDCIASNYATLGKLIWNICDKEDILWVKWVNQIYLRGTDWWQHIPPVGASWVWKKLCITRGKLAPGYQGDKWLHTKNGKYSVSSCYKWLTSSSSRVTWAEWVWNRYNVPKHRFICWLAMQQKLQTKDRLKRVQVCTDNLCCLCGQQPEEVTHLFFQCSYSRLCFRDWCRIFKLDMRRYDLIFAFRTIKKSKSHTRRQKKILYSGLAAIVYGIWLQRNNAHWQGVLKRPAIVAREAIAICKARCKYVMSRKLSPQDLNWCNSLDM